MFCKIRKGKNYFTIYACSRERVDGKVVSKDKKICRLAWHSLYEDEEARDGLIEEIPMDLYKFLNRMYFRNKDTGLNLFFDVEPKLIQVKKEYYPTYKKEALEAERILEQEEKERRKKQKKEYKDFKDKFIFLFSEDMSKSYKQGYKQGVQDSLYRSNYSSGGNTSYNSKEIKLLKEAFKLLAMKHHPDRGGDNETMAEINNLKEKILK